MQPATLEALFPPGVVAVSADAAALWDAPLHPGESSTIAHAAIARQREFAVGRACAREALSRLGVAPSAIPRNDARAPVWPAGVTGSITHCRAYCAAALGRSSQLRALGLDAERTGRVTPRILERVTSEAERQALRKASSQQGSADLATLVWCAKESVLKCLASATGRMPGPREIAIELAPSGFTARLRSRELASLDVTLLHGRSACHGDLVLAAVALPLADGPAAGDALP
jgi:4'-phosphopantetheinyl transferase EntD